MSEKQKKNGGNDIIDWSDYEIEPSSDSDAKSGTLDKDLETPVTVRDIDAPDLVAEAPAKPGMLTSLRDFQAGRIKKTAYIQQLKDYVDAQTKIYSTQVEKTVEAHQALTQSALEGVREKIKLWAKEIMLVTDISLQDSVNRAILACQENANKALTQLAKSDSHPVVVKEAMFNVTEFMKITMKKIMERDISFEKKGDISWDR